MICEHHTLSEEPFNFDINWPFPDDERKALVEAMNKIDISTPAEVNKLESELNEKISGRWYIWDQKNPSICKLWKPDDFNMSVDFYNAEKKIAIEVEKTEVKRIPRDFLKLINGSFTFVPKVRYGVIICPQTYRRRSGKESVFASRVFKEINFYFKRLITLTSLNDVLFIIYTL